MGVLTSPSGCLSCSRLADQIAELQGRISNLYQIRDAEQQMDAIVTFGPVESDSICDTTRSDVTDPGPATASSSADIPAAAAPSPVITKDPWTLLGAKPKLRSCSSLSHHEHWSSASAHNKNKNKKRGKKREKHVSCSPPSHGVELSNRFNVLNLVDFPPLPSNEPGSYIDPPAAPGQSSRPVTRRSTPLFTPAPQARAHSACCSSEPAPPPYCPSVPQYLST